MTTLQVLPKQNKFVEDFLSTVPSLDDSLFTSGPTQFSSPNSFRENCQKLKKELEYFPFPVTIFFAHKANKSKVFVNEAKVAGINVDVASYSELRNALSVGFSGENIECTGIKNEQFIDLAIKESCLIVVDSIFELDLIKKLSANREVRLLLRISDPFVGSYHRPTRFGIPRDTFLELLDKKELQRYKVEGLHFHFHDNIPKNKSMMIKELLSLYKGLYKHNFFPNKINIGGGYRFPLVNALELESVFEQIEQINFDDLAYANTLFGFERGRNGRLSKTQVGEKLSPLSPFEFIKTLIDHNQEEKLLIEDLQLSLCIEPGYALLENCSVLVMRVLGTKKIGKNKSAVIVDGNMYNLSTQMKTWITDPILISRNKREQRDESFEGFVIGNLCKEDDVLLDRKIHFERRPQNGDLLVFCNTAPYSGSFEDSDPCLMPKIRNYVFTTNGDGSFLIQTEKEYLEERNDN